jgi:hypothetical protein
MPTANSWLVAGHVPVTRRDVTWPMFPRIVAIPRIERREESNMYQTKNDLPEKTRADVIAILKARFVDSVDCMH